MAQSAGFHEDPSVLGTDTKDRHRALVSIQEELEAIDWYDQRVDAADDPELKEVLAHNRDEEKEHAAMTIEWLRRRDPVFDANLRTYLFTSAPVTEVEVAAEADGSPGSADGSPGSADGSPGSADGSLGIGGLRGVEQ